MSLQPLYPFPFIPSSFIHSATHSTKEHQVPTQPSSGGGDAAAKKAEQAPRQSGSPLCSDCSPPPPHMPFLFSTQSRLSGLGWGPLTTPGKLQARGQHRHLQYPQFTAEVLIQHSLPSHSSGGSPPSPGQMESSGNQGIPPPSSAVVTMLPAPVRGTGSVTTAQEVRSPTTSAQEALVGRRWGEGRKTLTG